MTLVARRALFLVAVIIVVFACATVPCRNVAILDWRNDPTEGVSVDEPHVNAGPAKPSTFR